MFLRIQVPTDEADYFNRSGSKWETECSRISSASLASMSSKDTDIRHMNAHTGERKRLAHIENSDHQQYGGTLEQNRNHSKRIYDG
jgi:hypothetical protein